MGTPARWWEDHFFLFFFYPHRKWLGERRGQEENLLRQGDSIAWAQTGGQDLPASDPCRFSPNLGCTPWPGQERTVPALFSFGSLKILTMWAGGPQPI